MDEISVDEASSCSTVQEGFDGVEFACIRGSDFYWQEEGSSSCVQGTNREELLFSHLGLWSRAGTGGLGGGASVSSLSIVLGSSIVNTVNLFTGDRGTLIAGRAVTPLEDFLRKCSMGYILYP